MEEIFEGIMNNNNLCIDCSHFYYYKFHFFKKKSFSNSIKPSHFQILIFNFNFFFLKKIEK